MEKYHTLHLPLPKKFFQVRYKHVGMAINTDYKEEKHNWCQQSQFHAVKGPSKFIYLLHSELLLKTKTNKQTIEIKQQYISWQVTNLANK